MTEANLIPPWSYSALRQYLNCPYQYYRCRVAKDVPPAPKSQAMKKGEEVHKRIEQRLRSKRPLPDELVTIEPVCRELEAMDGTLLVEHQMALNRQMEPVEWFDRQAWIRAAADAMVVQPDQLVVVDWKTGKVKFDELQSHILALVAWLHFPNVRTIRTRFVFTRTGDERGETYSLPGDGDFLFGEIKSVLDDLGWSVREKAWPKKPTGLCGWCDVKDCVHNSR